MLSQSSEFSMLNGLGSLIRVSGQDGWRWCLVKGWTILLSMAKHPLQAQTLASVSILEFARLWLLLSPWMWVRSEPGFAEQKEELHIEEDGTLKRASRQQARSHPSLFQKRFHIETSSHSS
eukprot:870320-Amphidinium_carterae.1